MISQRDSEFSGVIAVATAADGVAMKTIAIVTMVFLPATFVTVSTRFLIFFSTTLSYHYLTRLLLRLLYVD